MSRGCGLLTATLGVGPAERNLDMYLPPGCVIIFALYIDRSADFSLGDGVKGRLEGCSCSPV